jgi:hypothetical protein
MGKYMGRPARFNKKVFTSFVVLFIWIAISLTGIVLYFTPPGRIANYIYWTFLGLSKTQWQTIHTIFAFLFVIFGSLHLYFNWVVFWSYLKSKVAQGIKMKKELAWAFLLFSLILLITITGIPPVSNVMDFGEDLKNSWGGSQAEPPVPHAERMTLVEYSKFTQTDLNENLNKLIQVGLKNVDSLIVIETLAEKNNLTPQQIVSKMKPPQTSFSQSYGGQGAYGFGRKTVEQICSENGIEFDIAKVRLNVHGITFKDSDNLRQLAENYEVKPYDLVEIIKGTFKNSDELH